MDQAGKVEKAGGNKASQSVFYEVIESYSALKMGNGIHTPGTPNNESTYKRAHAAAMALDPSYSDQGVHVDQGHFKAGYNTYFYKNPTTGNQAILFDTVP